MHWITVTEGTIPVVARTWGPSHCNRRPMGGIAYTVFSARPLGWTGRVLQSARWELLCDVARPQKYFTESFCFGTETSTVESHHADLSDQAPVIFCSVATWRELLGITKLR